MSTPAGADARAGVAYVGLAYAIWGLLPLYWRLLSVFSPVEVLMHRVVWCMVFVGVLIVLQRRFGPIGTILRTPALFATLALSSVLIAVNWAVYLYCVATNRLLDASLGYYIGPLVSFALGALFFGDRLSAPRLVAVGFAVLAVVVKGVGLDHLPWMAATLAITFGLYGYIRKRLAVAAMDGLFVETALMAPFALGVILWWTWRGESTFATAGIGSDLTLMGSGPLTAIPLILFAAGARQITLSTVGFLQYLTPSIILLIAVFWSGEPFTAVDALSFGCVWAGLAVIGLDATGLRLYAGAKNRSS